MGGAPAQVVKVPALAVIDIVAGGAFAVNQEAPQEADSAVAFAHQHVPQLVRHGQRAQRAQRVDEQRMRAVEGIDVAQAVGGAGPARRLNGAGDFQGQFAGCRSR